MPVGSSRETVMGIFLVVLWRRLHASNTGASQVRPLIRELTHILHVGIKCCA